MARKKIKKNMLGLNMLGLLAFLLCIPLFIKMGGGGWLMAEVLPGQVSAGGITASRLLQGSSRTDAGESVGAAIWGVDDVEFHRKSLDLKDSTIEEITAEELQRMQDFAYLKRNYYIVDSRTSLLESDVNVKEALRMDFQINTSKKEPKVLIFHTHSHEAYADSDMSKGMSEGIWGVGEELKNILETEYGISVLHDDGRYDVVDGKGQILGAYERMEPNIRKILAENPSIEVCIDMHRDGVKEDVRLVADVEGVQCAQVMLFDGLCRLNNEDIAGLENPYIKENLAFSLQMQVIAGQNFPGLTRKIYLGAYRFSLHMMPRSVLIEVGAQTNTKAEALNAMAPLAKVLATVLSGHTS